MKLQYDLIVFDLESNGPYGGIIEIGAVKFNRAMGLTKDFFQTYVNIPDPIDPEITELTGITNLDSVGAPYLTNAVHNFYTWATKDTKNVVLASWGSYDTSQLRLQLEEVGDSLPFRGKSIDIKSIGVFVSAMLNKKHQESLQATLTAYGLNFEGKQHRALHDAFNTARLLDHWFNLIKKGRDDLTNSLNNLGIL